jgi:hypothetical protein
MAHLAPDIANGKVLKLHFACHAELPHGSSLRITASNSLLAPTVDTRQPTDTDVDENSQHSIYASSVEMVTSPDEYPVWRTRTPVICVVNNVSNDSVFKHRYKYLVVTPGAGPCDGDESENENEVKTSDDQDGRVDVTVWEDPFSKQTSGHDAKVVRFNMFINVMTWLTPVIVLTDTFLLRSRQILRIFLSGLSTLMSRRSTL